MWDLVPSIPLWAIVLAGLCVVALLALIGSAIFAFIFKAAVVIGEARKPPHLDAGDYRLSQGREIRTEGSSRQRDERR